MKLFLLVAWTHKHKGFLCDSKIICCQKNEKQNVRLFFFSFFKKKFIFILNFRWVLTRSSWNVKKNIYQETKSIVPASDTVSQVKTGGITGKTEVGSKLQWFSICYYRCWDRMSCRSLSLPSLSHDILLLRFALLVLSKRLKASD